MGSAERGRAAGGGSGHDEAQRAVTVNGHAAGGEPLPERTFTSAFRVGRAASCEVQLEAASVSRVHLEVVFTGGHWWARDAGSANGTWCDERRVERVRLDGRVQLRLGRNGPTLVLSVPAAAPPARAGSPAARPRDVEHYARHYLGDGAESEPAGEHTMMIRRAFAAVRSRQRRRYGLALAALAALMLGIGGYALVQRARHQARERRMARKVEQVRDEHDRLRGAAAALFDELKKMEVQVAQLRHYVEEKGGAALADQLADLDDSRRRLARRYDGYIETHGLRRRLRSDEQVIYRLARVFNESEFGMPAAFVDSVKAAIRDYWQTGVGRGRLERALATAARHGYTGAIVQELQRHGLPAQFFYLALQESNFDRHAIGPLTRWGRAKGMWQFIPRTALLYGLDPGPYPDKDLIDAHDERHDFAKSTRAAARYLETIYATLAQASGLLVTASYNWGEHRIVDRLEQLAGPQAIPEDALRGIPEDPTQRNYWRFLGEYRDRMPEETKDYVLRIFSAAVIGEDPRLFGFDFDNPLAPFMEQRAGEPD